MSDGCDISICIASYNARDYLLACLASIYQHPPQVAFEIIVVNDFSGDGTAEAVAETYPKVRLIENPERVGIARDRRFGPAAAGTLQLEMAPRIIA